MKTKNKICLGGAACVTVGSATTGGALLVAEAAPAVSALRAPVTAIPRGRIVVAQHAGHEQPAKDEAGEGGETKSLANLPAELAFAVRIALLRGHLLVGDELVQQQQCNAALPHFLHPTEEIYGDLKDQLADYKVPAFYAALKALSDVFKP